MNPDTLHKLERLAAAHIRLLPDAKQTTHFVFERGGYVALVERRETEFGSIGSAGRLNGDLFETLVWKQDQPFFVSKVAESAASPQQVDEIRAFQRDLTAALS